MSTSGHGEVLDALARASRRTALLGLLGFAIVLAAMSYSALRLRGLAATITAREVEVAQLEQRLDSARTALSEAQRQLDEAHRLMQSTAEALTRSEQAAHRIRQGINHYQRGEYDFAVAAYREAITIEPRNHVVYDYLGYSLFRQGDYVAAIESYRRSLSLVPSYWRAHYNMALALWRSGATDEALAAVEAAIAINPHSREDFRTDGQFSAFRQSQRFRDLIAGG